MIRFSGLWTLTICVMAITGCSADALQTKPQVVATPDKVTLMLADAADKASNALETLAAVEQARSPDIAVGPVLDAPPELRRAVTVSWTGPAEPITKMMADRAGYVFQALGDPPPVPIVVTVNAENQQVIDVLRSIGLQLGVRADVRVDAAKRLVEIQYAPPTGVGR